MNLDFQRPPARRKKRWIEKKTVWMHTLCPSSVKVQYVLPTPMTEQELKDFQAYATTKEKVFE